MAGKGGTHSRLVKLSVHTVAPTPTPTRSVGGAYHPDGSIVLAAGVRFCAVFSRPSESRDTSPIRVWHAEPRSLLACLSDGVAGQGRSGSRMWSARHALPDPSPLLQVSQRAKTLPKGVQEGVEEGVRLWWAASNFTVRTRVVNLAV